MSSIKLFCQSHNNAAKQKKGGESRLFLVKDKGTAIIFSANSTENRGKNKRGRLNTVLPTVYTSLD
jgi:hypothetical protein